MIFASARRTPLILIPGARARGLRRYSWLRIEKVTAWFGDTDISREVPAGLLLRFRYRLALRLFRTRIGLRSARL